MNVIIDYYVYLMLYHWFLPYKIIGAKNEKTVINSTICK